jgi:succinate-semialdehyde dehydrogenase/glutarate-semialdehyde dehydrogenase
MLTDVPAGSPILCEQTFGPIALITTFTTESQAIAAPNDTVYGLAVYLLTRDLNRALPDDRTDNMGMPGLNTGS